MITSYNLEISLRKYLIDKYGFPVVLKKQGWKVPDSKPFFTVRSTVSDYAMLTKNKELIQENVLIEIGSFADSAHELAPMVANVKMDVLYANIPLLDNDGTEIGKFSFASIISDSEVIDDVQVVEDETNTSRRYIEASTSIALYKR